ncbi:hypothetical protein D9M73_163630 [compost metagenome]
MTTSGISSISSPRAATSVATRKSTSPALNRCNARRRAGCGLSPWIESAASPSCCNRPTSSSTPLRVLANTSAWRQRFSCCRCRNSSALRFLSTGTSHCFTVFAAVLRGVTSMVSGSLSSPAAIWRMASEKVAENSRVCRRAGSAAKSSSNSRAKPRSSMRSASSSTRVCSWANFTAFCRYRSSSRPGVATSTSTPLRSFSICGLRLTPP